ncbi:MAG: PIN domain-containing protein [Candidatus Delongbacteria bacterium]|nr:PIN domain-containing protein [Candidatus Delongbacteria bacterium]
MIIVDTSIWIDFFKKKLDEFDILINLIETGQVIILDVIAAELLQGAKSKREVKIIKAYWDNLVKYSEHDLIVQAGEFSYENKFIDKGIGLIDSIIITATKNSNSKLWTRDKKILNNVTKDLIFCGIKDI